MSVPSNLVEAIATGGARRSSKDIGDDVKSTVRTGVRAVLSLAVTLLGVTFVTFVIGRVIPIDPVIAHIGERITPELYHKTFLELGLDRPLVSQYALYLEGVLSGDLGMSRMTGRSVVEDIARYFPATLELSTVAMALGVILGVPLGVVSALYRDRWADQGIRLFCLFGYSVPAFWLGMIALQIFYVWLGWTSGPGRLDVAFAYSVEPVSGLLLLDTAVAGDWEVFADALSHLVLPAVILGWYALAHLSRITRALMLTELDKDYCVTARTMGLGRFEVAWRHAFPNILVQLLTLIALVYASLLEGAVLTETVFAWPGLGSYIKNAVVNADMNALLGGTLVVGIAVVTLNALSDILGYKLDPRVR